MAFKIRKFQKSDTLDVTKLICQTFLKFNKNDYFDKNAITEYINKIDPKKNKIADLAKIFSKSPICYIATDNKEILGIVRGNKNYLKNLFVSVKCQGRGVGSALTKKFEFIAKKQGSDCIKLRAIAYALPFYERISYKKTTGLRKFHGLKVYPMKKLLN